MTEGVRGGAGSGFKFQVLGVLLLSPPETGGVPAGGGGMTQGQVKVLAVGTRHAET